VVDGQSRRLNGAQRRWVVGSELQADEQRVQDVHRELAHDGGFLHEQARTAGVRSEHASTWYMRGHHQRRPTSRKVVYKWLNANAPPRRKYARG